MLTLRHPHWSLLGVLALTLPACRDAGSGEDDLADGSSSGADAADDTPGDDDDDDDDDDADGDSGPVLLEPEAHLVRVSMALRGRRPSLGDLDRVADDPDALPEIVDGYLDSAQFGEVLRDLHNDALLMDAEIFELEALGELADETPSRIAESVLQEPLRMVEHIVREDRPYTEIVTADYWVVDHRASVVWGTDYDADGPDWQEVDPPDGRPSAGILSTNGFYMRHESCGFNFNRGRAHQLADALLCHDFLSSDIDIDGSIDLSDPEAVATAVQTVGACMGCHQTLDPLASAMNGFFEVFFPDPGYEYPLEMGYLEEFEQYWPELTGRPPAFYGQPIDDLSELGVAIADDPRFSLCTATRFYSYFAQVPKSAVPVEVASELQGVLEDSGFSARALIRHIMLSDEFRAAYLPEDGEGDPEELVGYKRARPFQLANLIEQLTGYQWLLNLADIEEEPVPDDEVSLARSAFLGFEVLAGGHDSFFHTTADITVNATTLLFMRRMASASASYVVEQDFAREPDDRRLLELVEPDDTDAALIREQLVVLFRRLYGERVEPDDVAVDDAYAIFEAVAERTEDPAEAWKATLAALLQDLDIIFY